MKLNYINQKTKWQATKKIESNPLEKISGYEGVGQVIGSVSSLDR
jgi:hypothetical protein